MLKTWLTSSPKYESKTHPKYFVKEIDTKVLAEERDNCRLKIYHSINGSSTFQVMVFKPGSSVFWASPRICVCDKCMLDYGSCSLFNEYQLVIQELNKISLRSNIEPPPEADAVEQEDRSYLGGFLLSGSVCAVAADKKSINTVWFIHILEEKVAETVIIDDYGQKINEGFKYFRGNYMEESKSSKEGALYKIDTKRTTCFFKERIVYPFVRFDERKNGFFLQNVHLVDILHYAAENRLAAL